MQQKVLIVDDETPIREMYELKFKHCGYAVDTARSGHEAMDKIHAEKPDLILLDLMMPKPDGFDVLEYLKRKGSTIPVIIISNLDQESEKDKSFAFGIQEYFVKAHVTPAEVVQRARLCLGTAGA